MRIFFIPYAMRGITKQEVNKVFLHRDGEKPRLFMHHVTVSSSDSESFVDQRVEIYGEFAKDESIQTLQENDRLFFPVRVNGYNTWQPFYLDMYVSENMLLPFQTEANILSIAAQMENVPAIYVAEKSAMDLLNKADRIKKKADILYAENISYQNIMIKREHGIEPVSILKLASIQKEEKQDTLVALFLSISAVRGMSTASIAERILKQCEFDQEISLLTQEEQVSAFIEFSKMIAKQKIEYVPDELIAKIQNSFEYQRVLEDLKRNALGVSKTQQFNVFQQVGFFSKNREENILYNLSDMGAGKTLMTVEAIYMLDLKQISTWKAASEDLENEIEICNVFLPDKHIIAPTLSVKSSWINTFRLFYDVTEINDMTYELSVTFCGVTAKSRIYVSSFTVKDGKVFVKEKLPVAEDGTYLIIDEIHQLVNRNVAKTKFYPPKTKPVDIYKIFILSGTMSNMKTKQWYNFMRFMAIPVSKNSPAQAETMRDNMLLENYKDIRNAAENIKSEQHRYFDTDPITKENYYKYRMMKKQTAVEQEFFTRYSSQILCPYSVSGENFTAEDMLTKSAYTLEVDSEEMDAINFELFYSIVGSKAITAQSLQIAEELFGTQKKQHASDIIKTVSPLSKSDIQILKVLHHIAEDYPKYKSQLIAKNINNAILNLNDGLQTKNIYDIVAGYAEKNMRFFEYLSGLDINILEKLPESGLIEMPKLEDTDKFKVLQDILAREKDETHLIVVNDYYALKTLSDALGIEHLTKDQLKHELDYQDVLDDLFEKQSIVIVTQDMIKSSLDLVQANRLIQYQLNTEISDIIQTQNRINRIGQTRETRGYYIASDQLQENLIELFLESYRNIRVAHKGIVELFTDITSQINIINDYLERAITAMEEDAEELPVVQEADEVEDAEADVVTPPTDLRYENALPSGAVIVNDNDISKAILFPQNGNILVLVPLTTGNAFPIGALTEELSSAMNLTAPKQVSWNLKTKQLIMD